MTPNTPPEALALAREIGAKHDANKAYQFLEGSRDDYGDMRMIIAAIMEVTERAAGLVEAARYSTAEVGTVDSPARWNRRSIAAALRNWEHLKQ